MKKQFHFVLTTSAASVLALSAFAEDAIAPKTEHPDHAADRLSDGRRMNRLNGAAKASELIGMTVKNYQDEKLGKVEDLAVDVESGRIVQVIISTGGFIGIGDRLTAVPPGALHHDLAKKVLHLNVDKDKLKSAPAFETSKWAEHSDTQHLTEVYRYYGEEPSLRFINKGDDDFHAARRAENQRTTELNRQGRPDTTRPSASDSTPGADGSSTADRMRGDSHFMIPASRLSQVQKASKLIGTAVQNLQDEKLGKVENLLVDLASGRVVAVVVSSGGFLGMGDELSALPPSALHFTTDRHALQLDTTKEMLGNAPHFKAQEWPDFAEPTYTEGVYQAYHVRPYFKEDMTKDADNTARNVRDRNSRGLTPLDQGNSDADRASTADIRKAIMADKSFSLNARNVKIITLNGQVTLRGPVNSPDERTRIEEIAARISGVGNVNNQLEARIKADGASN